MNSLVILDNLIDELMEITIKSIESSGKLNDVTKAYLVGLREGIIQGILYSKGFNQSKTSTKRVTYEGENGWLFTKVKPVKPVDINEPPLSAISELKIV
jgi:hypothetical protein